MKSINSKTSLPTRERGLKQNQLHQRRIHPWSLPTRERGLKLMGIGGLPKIVSSLPTRERGLKLAEPPNCCQLWQVAPHAGAWIETSHEYLPLAIPTGRPPRRSGDCNDSTC